MVEHYRQWICYDGIVFEQIREENKLSRKNLRQIARRYEVGRGITGATDKQKKNGQDPHADWLASELNSISQGWPDTLKARAEKCAEIAECAKTNGHSKYLPASAITKLIWFIQPDGWTMFDNLAALGLRSRNTGNSVIRMKAFYKELAERKFSNHACSLNRTIQNTDFSDLYGERIIDKFLMILGASVEWRENLIQENEIFLSLIPESLKNNIHKLAKDISDCHADSLLKKEPESS
ncbi:hypothetical protein [Sneathiella chinensis]|uniref:hypothetical protein n=1 Tax=Sneathiella chinensis TaxID=349750 RepID=UPI00146D856C|nr:hypothetical protein [Sneathiella chinensis]